MKYTPPDETMLTAQLRAHMRAEFPLAVWHYEDSQIVRQAVRSMLALAEIKLK